MRLFYFFYFLHGGFGTSSSEQESIFQVIVWRRKIAGGNQGATYEGACLVPLPTEAAAVRRLSKLVHADRKSNCKRLEQLQRRDDDGHQRCNDSNEKLRLQDRPRFECLLAMGVMCLHVVVYI